MSPIDFHAALRQRPFSPFRVEVSDGTAYEVRHPELVMVGIGAIIIGFPAAGQPQPTYERIETVSLAHVVKLIPLEPAGKPSNGPAKQ